MVMLYVLTISVLVIATFEFVEQPCRKYMRAAIKQNPESELTQASNRSQPA